MKTQGLLQRQIRHDPRPQLHHRRNTLAQCRMRQTHNSRFQNIHMRRQRRFHLDGKHILTAANDHVLLAVYKGDEPLRIAHRQIT